ncbi:MAG TPA: glycoside hydrolase family 9 protein, partial [Ruminococcus sp.]|nr:glycoside hydrolase family 9 protein [Ruminococcus sp.]
PKAPCGVMAGGPNSGMQDPWVQGSGWKKGQIPPQKCYLDHIEAWSVNECTINWNASLAWLSGFVAQENGDGQIEVGQTGRSAGLSNDGGEGESNEKKTYDEDTDRKSTKVDADDEDEEEKAVSKKTTASDSKTDKTSMGIVGIIAAAAVAVIISILVFIYKVMKLKYDNKK